MENSILRTIKKMLGLEDDYTPFDQEIIVFINSAISSVSQIGGIKNDWKMVSDEYDLWSDIIVDDKRLEIVKNYVFLKVKIAFDPPSTSFVLEAMNKQISEFEWRLNVISENDE